MQFSAVLNIFIVKTQLNSTFTNDLKRNKKKSKNVHSYRVCSFKAKLVRIHRVAFGKANSVFEQHATMHSHPKCKDKFYICISLV